MTAVVLTALRAEKPKEAKRRLQAIACSQPKRVPALCKARSSFQGFTYLLAMGRADDAIANFNRVRTIKADFTQVHQLKLVSDARRSEAAAIARSLSIASSGPPSGI